MIFTPDILAGLGAGFDGKPSGENAIRAVIDGIPVEVRFVLRNHGSSSTKATEISVKAADITGFAFSFNFDIRPTELGDAGNVRDGRLRDVVLGDAAFDEAFVVEAAPEAVVRHMFDAETRAQMLALQPLRVLSTSKDAVMIERLDWILDPGVLAKMTRLTARIAASMIPAAREATHERRRNAAQQGSYRDRAPTDEEIRAEWDFDVQRLGTQIEQRRAREKKIALTAVLGVLGIITVVTVILATRC